VAALFDGLALHAAHTDVDVGALRREAEVMLVEMLGLDEQRPVRRRRHSTAQRR
jgi:hypothetical protein